MCFSPQADLVGGLVLGVIGIDVARNVHERRDHLAFAALPLLFAAHQLTETFVWWGLQGHVASRVGVIATCVTIDGFASVWCGWAALTSVAIAAHIRFGRPHTTVVQALA